MNPLSYKLTLRDKHLWAIMQHREFLGEHLARGGQTACALRSAPHSSQNFEPLGFLWPQDEHRRFAATASPSPHSLQCLAPLRFSCPHFLHFMLPPATMYNRWFCSFYCSCWRQDQSTAWSTKKKIGCKDIFIIYTVSLLLQVIIYSNHY